MIYSEYDILLHFTSVLNRDNDSLALLPFLSLKSINTRRGGSLSSWKPISFLFPSIPYHRVGAIGRHPTQELFTIVQYFIGRGSG